MSDYRSFLLSSKSATAAVAKKETTPPRQRRILELPDRPSFYINNLPLLSRLPPETKRWLRDATDERAAIEYGCRFQESKGQYVVDWIEGNCTLYEGENAGELMSVDDWQYELYMQWGWLYFSKEWALKTGQESRGWVRRFRKISGWVPKKNAKSPTLAAAGLYTLMADGERGQKCFSVAKDVNQALVSHSHALEFVRQSPAFQQYCKINATTSEITDLRTKSKYSIRSGSTASNRDRNEGLNGSLFIDETHVVDEQQMSILGRAGISRRQFLLLQLSTAGSNTAGYGYKECLAGRANIKSAEEGLPFNFRMKHLEFAVDPEVSMEDLRDPTKIEGFIRQANPTLGRIVMHDEIIQDWRESVPTDTKLGTFAMYRLNKWDSSGGSYIAGSDWAKCYRRFSFKEMKQFPCVVGGDFSRRRDMTCVMLMFAVPTVMSLPVDPFDELTEYEDREINVPHIHPYFFLPERAVEQYKRHINLEDYASRGLLTITKGATVRAQTIAALINRIDSQFDLRKVGSDSYYSADIAQCLAGDYSWNVEGDDSKLALISQTCSSIGPAVEQLMNLVLNQEIVHNNNALMNWQLGNIRIVEDSNGNRRFEKPTADSPQKIDGWAGLANGIFVMMSDPDLYPGQVFSIKA